MTHRFLVLMLLLVTQACGRGGDGEGGLRLLANQSGAANDETSAFSRFQQAFNSPTADRRRLGSDNFLNLPSGPSRNLIEASEDGAFSLNLVDVPIEQAVNAVLGTALERTYTISPDVRGTVTLQTSRPLSERDLLETFQIILEINGATLQMANDVITVVPLSGASASIVRPQDLERIGGRIVAVPLRYIGTTEMVRLLEPIGGETLRLQSIPNRNVLLIAGTRNEINTAIEAVNLFDVDVLEGQSVGLYQLRAADPEAVVEELNAIFATGDGGSLQNVVTFLPSQRLNAILVISSRANYLAEAEEWIRNLDNAAGGSQRRPVVYNLQNRSADDLAPVLSEMIDDITSESGNTVEGSARIVADDARNAVIVWGNDSEQEVFARLIQSLDTAPVQVLLEATIAEVTLNDELNFGLRWFFENGGVNGTFTNSETGSVGPSFPGLSFLFQGASASAALSALNSVTTVNVVSSPSLMVLDNQEAQLQIGDEVPIATQQVREIDNPSAPIVNTISFRDTGIILAVRPRVSSSGQVVLDIEQEVSTVSNTTTSGIDSPTISQRRIQTSVVVSNGQTLALGGLIEESRNGSNAQVPGLGDVPVLGGLFRNRSDTIARTELLVLITPQVIRSNHEALAATRELRNRINQANGVVETGIIDPGIGHRIID
ncbi:type II secretion system secretin GspD [Rhodophyticola porphyridii]|uniref:type II secretion system secretin GspD n=1 Tax=Rhodophyticola porphyridii TaxID=1852017 RepID=UPI001B16FE49|nr:type II secretion system secretin GspD [Roseicyclus sp.]